MLLSKRTAEKKLEKVDQTHLVQAVGKSVLQKNQRRNAAVDLFHHKIRLIKFPARLKPKPFVVAISGDF